MSLAPIDGSGDGSVNRVPAAITDAYARIFPGSAFRNGAHAGVAKSRDAADDGDSDCCCDNDTTDHSYSFAPRTCSWISGGAAAGGHGVGRRPLG